MKIYFFKADGYPVIKYGNAGFIIFLLIVSLSACSRVSVLPKSGDAAPNRSVNVNNIPNAIPKNEPKSRYGNPKSYEVFGKRYYVMESSRGYVENGIASWYGTKFHGRRTSSGETYDMYAMTAAHKSLPLPTYVKVTSLNNGRSVILRVNDRGPFHENRIIDLSYSAALKLDIVKRGTGLVKVQALTPGEPVETVLPVAAPVEVGVVENNISGFSIQVGSFSELPNAEKLRNKLRPLAAELVRISQIIIGVETLYRVRIGPLHDIEQSDSIVSKLIHYDVTEHHIVVNE